LALAVGKALEVDRGTTPVLAQEALAYHVLESAYVIEEWCRTAFRVALVPDSRGCGALSDSRRKGRL
jgi:hypothetical protein